jgi:hypothetical protein
LPTDAELEQPELHQAEVHSKEEGESSEIDLDPSTGRETSEQVAEPSLAAQILTFPDGGSEDEPAGPGGFVPGVTSWTDAEAVPTHSHQPGTPIDDEESESRSC